MVVRRRELGVDSTTGDSEEVGEEVVIRKRELGVDSTTAATRARAANQSITTVLILVDWIGRSKYQQEFSTLFFESGNWKC